MTAMTPIELINALACLVLLAMLMPLAVRVRRMRYKVVMIIVTAVLGMQVVNPIACWLPMVPWSSAAMNVLLAFTVVHWRAELWALLRHKLGLLAPGETEHSMRRSDDFAEAER